MLKDSIYKYRFMKVPAVVHLTNVTRNNVSNAQVSIVSDLQSGPAALQQFFFGSASGQHSGSSRLNIFGPGNHHIRVIGG